MSIDLSSEEVLSLEDAIKRLPAKGRRRLHLSTIYRWAQRGVRGVLLETISVGGARMTSTQAIQRFCDGVTAARQGRLVKPKRRTKPASPRAKAAKRRLDSARI